MPFAHLRPFLHLPPEPAHPITWFTVRAEALEARTGDLRVTHGTTPHPLTHQHGLGTREAVAAWSTWTIEVNARYTASELDELSRSLVP